MFRHHLKIAIRNIFKNKAYAAINIGGLLCGVIVAVLTFWVVRFEKSFDDFHANGNLLYQIRDYDKFGNTGSHVPQGLIKAAKTQVPGIEKAAAIYQWNPQVIRVNHQNLHQDEAYFVSPEFPEMMGVKWIAGSPEESLARPDQVVLDKETADILFKGDAMGKVIRMDNKVDLVVSGVVGKSPVNSDFQLKMMISYETLKEMEPEYKNEDYWGGGDSYYHGYVMLKPGADPVNVERLLTQFAQQHKDESNYVRFDLNPIRKAHFDVKMDNFNYSMPLWLLNSLSAIGLFILIIACVNFINLATVHAARQSREIAMRRILGSSKKGIVFQFFLETAIIVIIAVIAGMVFAAWLLPYVSGLLSTKAFLVSPWGGGTFLFLLCLAILIIFLSAAYPAVILSGFKPVPALRAQNASSEVKGISVRRVLVVGQFVIAQTLVIITSAAILQTRYLYHKDLGFDKENIVTLNMPERGSKEAMNLLRYDLRNRPDIKQITFGLTTPSSTRSWWWRTVVYRGLPNGAEMFRVQYIDTDYFRFFQIPVVAGRSFYQTDTTHQTDTARQAYTPNNIVVNEKAASDMGLLSPDRALGERLTVNGETFTIVGVVKNFQSQSLKEQITPHVFFYDPGHFQTAAIRIDPGQMHRAIGDIGSAWKEAFPDYYFSYVFLSDDIRSFYGTEDKFTHLLTLLAIAGILIGCLGLYGLVSLVCLQKVKEIGVRKVLGATTAGILTMLTWDFFKLVLIAFLIAVPAGYYITRHFLQDYAYRIEISWLIFLVAFGFSALLTIFTVSVRAVRASLTNPIDNLRET
ncbi:MAG TPA: ABC transporter permease [Puia sp.]|nr:ABC transporter permease [Puia sp.]